MSAECCMDLIERPTEILTPIAPSEILLLPIIRVFSCFYTTIFHRWEVIPIKYFHNYSHQNITLLASSFWPNILQHEPMIVVTKQQYLTWWVEPWEATRPHRLPRRDPPSETLLLGCHNYRFLLLHPRLRLPVNWRTGQD